MSKFQTSAKGARSIVDSQVEGRYFRDGQLSRLTGWCRGYRRQLMVVVVVTVLWAALAAGCVNTAECDEHVGCSEGFVCYQIHCLPACEDQGDCDDDEICAPCDDDEVSRCPGDSGRKACVADDDLMNDDDQQEEAGE